MNRDIMMQPLAATPTGRRWASLVAASALLATAFTVGFNERAPAEAAFVAPIDLGTASSFAILAGASIGNTASGPTTVVRGNVGVFAPAGAILGFPPGEIRGTLYPSGAPEVVAAHADVADAYDEAAARTSEFALAADLIGLTLHPGVHTAGGAVGNTGTVTLDGDGNADAVFILQINGALSTAASSHVVLTDGAQAKNVFWQVNGAGALGANSEFAGTLITAAAVGVGANSSFNGRALSKTGAITTDSNQFYSQPPSVTIAGGANASTSDETPTIVGNTNVESPESIEVRIGTQTIVATIGAGGGWSATAAILANWTYLTTATVTDRAGNVGVATQSLTIDTVLPVVSITNGATFLTNDSTPTIAGSTDVAVGSLVSVAVGGQTLSALVQVGNTWNVTPSALAEATTNVVASVVDEAGNPAAATQSLTVDTIAPEVTISGGPSALTNDNTPAISGTSTDAGSPVTISVSGQSFATTVQSNGSWTASAPFRSDGIHPVSVSITDPAGNARVVLQTLHVDTVAPSVSITGGVAVTTNDPTPTLIGSSDSVVGSLVTVSVAGQLMTTLVQADGSYNATPNALAQGTHTVLASVADPAGNVGTSTQQLTVDAAHVDPPTTTTPPTTTPPTTTPPTTTPAGVTRAVVAVGPKRVFDTRVGQSANALRSVPAGQVGEAPLEVRLTDLAGYVPIDGVGAVSLNVTVTGSSAPGFVTVYSCGIREAVSSVNFAAGQTVANAVIAPVSATGTVCFFASSPTDVIVDVNGWFKADEAFAAVGPKRAFDTRSTETAPTLRAVPKRPILAGTTLEVQLTDLDGFVPASGVDSISLNVTVTNPTAPGYVTVYDCGPRQLVSNVNYRVGQTVANAVLTPVSPTGTVCFYSPAEIDLVVDVNGWFRSNSGFTSVSPKRVLDTRSGESPDALRAVTKGSISGATILEVQLTDLADVVPVTGVAAVSLNVTATNTAGDGFITVYACGRREEVSSVNFAIDQTVANAIIAPLSPTGTICIFSSAPADVVVDINGWFSTGE